MRLVACPSCHAQFDVTAAGSSRLHCHCGEALPDTPRPAIDAPIRRCSACGAGLGDGAARCEFCGSTVERDARRLSLICPECFARNADRARYCGACGVEFAPQSLPAEQVERACPACDGALSSRSIGGLRLEECTSCHGLWAPGESFDRLVERAVVAERRAKTTASTGLGAHRSSGRNRRAPFSGEVAYRRCPVCEARMHRKNFGKRSGVIVDWCREHGTWLDADELEDIAAFIVDGGLERPGGDTLENADGDAGDGCPAQAPFGASPGLMAAVLGRGGPVTAEQVEALLKVECQFEETRKDSPRRARRAHHRHGGWRRTLADLFEGLLGG